MGPSLVNGLCKSRAEMEADMWLIVQIDIGRSDHMLCPDVGSAREAASS